MTRRPRQGKGRQRPSPKGRQAVKPRTGRQPDRLDEVLAANAKGLGLKIDKAWMPAVRSHFEVTLRHGGLVVAFRLPDEAEPAPVFKA
jgi:hypothetical protein